MGKKFYLDLVERVAWTFIEGFGAAWIAVGQVVNINSFNGLFSVNNFKVGLTAGCISAVKCLIASRVGDKNAALLPPVEKS